MTLRAIIPLARFADTDEPDGFSSFSEKNKIDETGIPNSDE